MILAFYLLHANEGIWCGLKFDLAWHWCGRFALLSQLYIPFHEGIRLFLQILKMEGMSEYCFVWDDRYNLRLLLRDMSKQRSLENSPHL